MEIKQNLCANAQRKAALLITKASDLGMDLYSYGEVGENQSNGNVYIWLEDYPFSLYIDLGSDTIKACWNSTMTDSEEIVEVGKQCLFELQSWAYKLEEAEQEREEA